MEGAIHVLLIHRLLFLLLLFSFFFFTLRTVYVFWIRCKIDVISSKTYSSVVRMTQVFDLEICSIQNRCCKDDLIMQSWFSDTLISARPLRGSHNPRLSGLGFNTTLVF